MLLEIPSPRSGRTWCTTLVGNLITGAVVAGLVSGAERFRSRPLGNAELSVPVEPLKDSDRGDSEPPLCSQGTVQAESRISVSLPWATPCCVTPQSSNARP